MRSVRVLIVDDSALIRQLLTTILNEDPAIEVVGTACDPYQARERIKQLHPDVLTLDVEMPRMDGITFLRNLMRLRPMPVVMISSLTTEGADVTLEALELGAVDFIPKPRTGIARDMAMLSEQITRKVRAAARARVKPLAMVAQQPGVFPRNNHQSLKTGQQMAAETLSTVVVIGASTGGTEAIKYILERLPADSPAVMITQHIPATFSSSFARRMDSNSALRVCEAEEGQPILPGHAYIAPGDQHLLAERVGNRYVCRLSTEAPVNRHRPAVDLLFKSVARCTGLKRLGILLTGMGTDGAFGLQELRNSGARTFAQDEASSVVWGMPGEAARIGAADQILALEKIPAAIDEFCNRALLRNSS